MITYSVGDKVTVSKKETVIKYKEEDISSPFCGIILSKLKEGSPLMVLPVDRELCFYMGKPLKTSNILEINAELDFSLTIRTAYSIFNIKKEQNNHE